jgi:hypothetical protein
MEGLLKGGEAEAVDTKASALHHAGKTAKPTGHDHMELVMCRSTANERSLTGILEARPPIIMPHHSHIGDLIGLNRTISNE